MRCHARQAERELAESLLRLARVMGSARALDVLHPAIRREICYWLLSAPHAKDVLRIASPDGHSQRIAKAIAVLRANYAQAIRMPVLAGAARMSGSTFYHYFKVLTGLSPLQYPKQIRLLEARRLMMDGAPSAESAAYQVGYASASQFSREARAAEARCGKHEGDRGADLPHGATSLSRQG